MKACVFTYEDASKQVVWYRGYVKKYIGNRIEEIHCGGVRKNRLLAMVDAKALLKELKKVK